MNDKDLRELDAYLAEHVMGWKKVSSPQDLCKGSFLANKGADCIEYSSGRFKPSTDPAAALMVLEKAAAKLAPHSLVISFENDQWYVFEGGNFMEAVKNDSLTLAVASFAKQLFSK